MELFSVLGSLFSALLELDLFIFFVCSFVALTFWLLAAKLVSGRRLIKHD